jgi:hypothetical protein
MEGFSANNKFYQLWGRADKLFTTAQAFTNAKGVFFTSMPGIKSFDEDFLFLR